MLKLNAVNTVIAGWQLIVKLLRAPNATHTHTHTHTHTKKEKSLLRTIQAFDFSVILIQKTFFGFESLNLLIYLNLLTWEKI